MSMRLKDSATAMAAAAVALCSLAASAASDLLKNGDFEAGDIGWRLPRGLWRVEKGLGMEKSSALVFAVGEDVKAESIRWAETTAAARFPVESGMGYRFEGWLKTDALKILRGGDLALEFAAYDAQGKCVKSCAAVRTADNTPGSDGWYRVEGVTPVLPQDAVCGGLFFYSGACVGTAYVDRLSVSPVALNPVDTLVVSAYRAEAWEGDVSFAAAYCVNPFRNPETELVATLEYMSPTGKVRISCQRKDGVASATLPVEAFAFGRNEVELALSRKGGGELGRSSCFFRREAEPMPRKVMFDGRHRTVVDGKLFFPLGMYWSWNDVAPATLARYTKDGPFNCLVGYGEQSEAKMDLCHAAGVRVIASLSGHFKEMHKAKTPHRAAEIDARYVRGRLRRSRTHPALIAWYLADEVPSIYERILAAKRDMVYELDPDHPTWIVLDKPGQVRELIRGFDVIGMDPYPVGNHGNADRTSIGIAAGWARSAAKSTYGFRPMWQVPQAFDWGYYRPNETNNAAVRMPTFAEVRSMTWQAIAAGANGLIYFSHFDLLNRSKWPKERTAGGWENVCAVAKEVKAFEPIFFSDDPVPELQGGDGDIAARAWSYGGKIHVVMANTLRKGVSGSIKVAGHEIPYVLEPIEVKFVTLDR